MVIGTYIHIRKVDDNGKYVWMGLEAERRVETMIIQYQD